VVGFEKKPKPLLAQQPFFFISWAQPTPCQAHLVVSNPECRTTTRSPTAHSTSPPTPPRDRPIFMRLAQHVTERPALLTQSRGNPSKASFCVSRIHVDMDQGYRCPPCIGKGLPGAAQRSYTCGQLREQFSLRRQVEVAEMSLKLTGIRLWWNTTVLSFAAMKGTADRWRSS
jgi:hypothetical protein